MIFFVSEAKWKNTLEVHFSVATILVSIVYCHMPADLLEMMLPIQLSWSFLLASVAVQHGSGGPSCSYVGDGADGLPKGPW